MSLHVLCDPTFPSIPTCCYMSSCSPIYRFNTCIAAFLFINLCTYVYIHLYKHIIRMYIYMYTHTPFSPIASVKGASSARPDCGRRPAPALRQKGMKSHEPLKGLYIVDFRNLFVTFSAVGIGCLRLVSYTFRNLGFGFPGLSSTVWKICGFWTRGVEVLHVGMPTQWAKMEFPGMEI